MKTIFRTLLLAVCLTPLGLRAENPTLFDQFEHTELLKLELEFSLDTMYAKVNTNEEYPAVFRFQDAHGAWVELSGEIRARGRYRRRVCDFPPLRIDFSKKDLRARGLADYDDLKLVTHCQTGRKGKEAVLREYLTYKMYQQLSDHALRAKLVEVTYIDTESNQKLVKYGILLEDIDELAARKNSVECEECFGLSTVEFQQDNLRTHAMFQYMIGNVDWSVPMSRNLKILKPVNGGLHTVVPYDFDFSGLVNVGYAVPSQEVGQTKVGDRVYLGAERSGSELQPTLELFKSKQDTFVAMVENFDFLSRSGRREMTEYLDSFYVALDNGLVCEDMAIQGCPTPLSK
ncbi:MAG: hypothetical protein RIC19_10125 [Phaeodactylibacter sp.]|uniref:hypothetical protein n=1 Tax=Phaeodactylibacter sp. TaxID=1940289 RepID=UPI0032EEADF1